MHRSIFRQSLKNTVARISLISVLLILLLGALGRSQNVQEGLEVRYFVSPEYPRLARQAMMSGDVVLTVTVDASGKPTDVSVKGPYALLEEGAKATVSKWRFNAVTPHFTRKRHVFIHYSFSGNARDCDPSTIVAADLESLRIIVTVDPLLPFQGDSDSPQKHPDKKQ